jgi:ArsR family transcriptional regulator
MDLKSFTAITFALSDSHRVRALMTLRNGELCVCQIIELFQLAPSTISKHMSILKLAGLVESRKEGRWVYYRLVESLKCDKEIRQMLKLAIAFLEHDKAIVNDDRAIAGIMKQGLETLCKKQK